MQIYLSTRDIQFRKKGWSGWCVGGTVHSSRTIRGISSPTITWEATAELSLLTSVSGPLSAPGQENVTSSWHLLWTTKQQTAEGRKTQQGSVYTGEMNKDKSRNIKTGGQRKGRSLFIMLGDAWTDWWTDWCWIHAADKRVQTGLFFTCPDGLRVQCHIIMFWDPEPSATPPVADPTFKDAVTVSQKQPQTGWSIGITPSICLNRWIDP